MTAPIFPPTSAEPPARSPLSRSPTGGGAATSRAGLRPGPALWLVASIVVTFLAASSAPSPLYALYREAWHFSAFALTLVFAVYAFTLLAALLVFGALSDHLGRRPVVLAALGLEAVAIALFWAADGVGWLFAARAVQGFATGLATGVLGALLLDLDPRRGTFVNSVAPMFGMAVGALGAAVLVQFAPWPLRLVHAVLLAVIAVQAALAWRLPDTVAPRPGAWAAMRPRVAVPARARATLLRLLPLNSAQWALGGFYLSLGPTLARVVTGSAAPVVGGALVATLVLASAAAIAIVHSRPPHRVLLGGALALGLGLAATLAAVALGSGVGLFGGTLVAGLGFGAAFNASVRSLVPLAEPHERGALMSGFFVLSYLAFSLPALAAGVAVGRFGLLATALGYGGVLLALVLAALAALVRTHRFQ